MPILLRSRVQGRNLNTRAALLEVVNDALGSVAVLAAAVIWLTGWARADAVSSLMIAVMILPRTWKLLRGDRRRADGGPPEGVDLGDVRAHILDLSACAAPAMGAWVVRTARPSGSPRSTSPR